MSMDRDLYMDTFFNVAKFAKEGLAGRDALEHRASRPRSTAGGWTPRARTSAPTPSTSSTTSPRRRSCSRPPATPTASKDVPSNYVTTGELGDLPKHAEVIDGMLPDAASAPRSTADRLQHASTSRSTATATGSSTASCFKLPRRRRRRTTRSARWPPSSGPRAASPSTASAQRQERPVRRPGDRRADREGPRREGHREAQEPSSTTSSATWPRPVRHPAARRRHQLPDGLARAGQLPRLPGQPPQVPPLGRPDQGADREVERRWAKSGFKAETRAQHGRGTTQCSARETRFSAASAPARRWAT